MASICWPCNLQHSLMSSRRFLWILLYFYIDKLYSLFCLIVLVSNYTTRNYIYFSCLIALDRTFSMMLNRSGEKAHFCLILNFKGKVFSFSPLSMISAVGSLQMLFIKLKFTLFLVWWELCIMNWCWILSTKSKSFSAAIDTWFSFSSLLM